MPRLVYSSYLFTAQVKVLVAYFVLAGSAFYSVMHFNENPVVIAIVTLFCVFCIITVGFDQVDIYTDRITYRYLSLWNFLKRKAQAYDLTSIKTASLPPDSSTVEKGVIGVLSLFFNKQRTNSYPFFLELKDGTTVRMDTMLGRNQSIKIVNTINSLL